MATFVPLISSGIAGPLGALHLPRLWQKVSLEARGKLDSRYPGIGKGYDAMTLAALGLQAEAVVNFIKDKRPTYPQFEAWIKNQPGAKLDAATVEKHNASVRGFNHDASTRQSVLKASGIPDEGKILDAIRLNDLESWLEFHEAELK